MGIGPTECRLGPQRKVLHNVIDVCYLIQLHTLQYKALKRGIWESTTSNGLFQGATKTLHCESPVHPDGSHSSNAIGNMQKRMNCYGTSREAAGLVLIIYSVDGMRKGQEGQNGDSLFVFLDPPDKSAADLFHLVIRDFELEAEI